MSPQAQLPSQCPFLPILPAGTTVGPRDIAALKNDRGAAFYLLSLQFAQVLWCQGLPAQGLLQLNRAFSADLSSNDPVLEDWPLPYPAMAYFLRHAPEDQFFGNPRRHWQHLATRMSGPRPELRTWRAWACWRLARTILPHLPADEEQIRNEGICEPVDSQIRSQLAALGQPGEMEAWWSVVSAAQPRS